MILVSYYIRPDKHINVIKELRSLTGCNLKQATCAVEHGIVVENSISVGDATYFLTRAYSIAYGGDNIRPGLAVNHNYVQPKVPATLLDLGLIERK